MWAAQCLGVCQAKWNIFHISLSKCQSVYIINQHEELVSHEDIKF